MRQAVKTAQILGRLEARGLKRHANGKALAAHFCPPLVYVSSGSYLRLASCSWMRSASKRAASCKPAARLQNLCGVHRSVGLNREASAHQISIAKNIIYARNWRPVLVHITPRRRVRRLHA